MDRGDKLLTIMLYAMLVTLIIWLICATVVLITALIEMV